MLRMHWTPSFVRTIANGRYGTTLREPRVGIMLHFDGSGTDEAAMAWFADPACYVSYHVLALDNGSLVRIAPDDARAWHAGYCRTSDPERLPYQDANSAFYGIAAATNGSTDVTTLQTLAIAQQCRSWFQAEGWDPTETWRIVGHRTEAVFGPNHPKAGQRGRRSDPEGADLNNPILAIADVRSLVPLLAPELT